MNATPMQTSAPGRNMRLTEIAGGLRRKGMDADAILDRLLDHPERDGLPDHECRSIAKSIGAKPVGSHPDGSGAGDASHGSADPPKSAFPTERWERALAAFDQEIRDGAGPAVDWIDKNIPRPPGVGFDAAMTLAREVCGSGGDFDGDVRAERPAILFPLRTVHGTLSGSVQVRYADDDDRPMIRSDGGESRLALKSRSRGPKSLIGAERLKGYSPNAPLIVCAGEKDFLSALMFGLQAVAVQGEGFRRLAKKEIEQLARFDSIRLIFDDDKDRQDGSNPGRAAAAATVAAWRSCGLNVSAIDPDRHWRGKDLTDWLRAGVSIETIRNRPIVDIDAEESPAVPSVCASGPPGLDDIGNGERFAAQHRGKVLYIPELKMWFYYDGKRWRADSGGVRVMQLAKKTARAILEEAARVTDDDARSRIASWSGKSARRDRLAAMIELARSEPGLNASVEEFDRDPMTFNVMNGTVDLKTGALRPHDPADRITKLASIRHDPRATAPRWIQFLHEVFDGDEALIAYLRRMVGYMLTGSAREEFFWIFIGTGANGKTVFVLVLKKIMGEFFHKCDSEIFVRSAHERRAGEATPHIAALRGVRVAVASETEAGRKLAETRMKELTGTEPLAAREPYGLQFEFDPSHKMILTTNHRPRTSQDDALWRRMRIVPFNRVFAESERDKKLPEKLAREASGILNWAIQGCLEWQRDGLGDPPAVAGATGQYRLAEDPVRRFITEECETGNDPAYRITVADMYESFARWGDSTGAALAKKTFGERLRELGYDQARGGGGIRFWTGIRVVSDRQ